MRTLGTFGWGLAFAALPALAQPALQFTAIRALASNQVELVWSSDTNRLFAIERTTDPGDWDNAVCVAIPEPSAQFASNRWAGAMDTTPAFFRVLASPPLDPSVVCHANLGTPTNDTQFVIGTTNRDYVMQFGNAGEDTQYVSSGDEADWIAQLGGAGNDDQTARMGGGEDWICQDGGLGNDTLSADGGDEGDWIKQQGGDGNDRLSVQGGWGNDVIYQEGGAGNDTMRVDGGHDDDFVAVSGGTGDDSITYFTSTGLDEVRIDGGAGYDTLIAHEIANVLDLTIRLQNGALLYSNGPADTVITVDAVELIHVVGGDGAPNWTWTAP